MMQNHTLSAFTAAEAAATLSTSQNRSKGPNVDTGVTNVKHTAADAPLTRRQLDILAFLRRRISGGFTQKDVARAAGVARANVSMLEQGKYMSQEYFDQIVRGLTKLETGEARAIGQSCVFKKTLASREAEVEAALRARGPTTRRRKSERSD